MSKHFGKMGRLAIAKRISVTALIPIEEVFLYWKKGLFWCHAHGWRKDTDCKPCKKEAQQKRRSAERD